MTAPERTSASQDEQVTLRAAQAGATWALRRVWELLAPAVAGYLRAQGAREVDDLANDVFLRVFAHLGRFDGPWEKFRSWVFTIAHNRLLDQRRALLRRPDPLPLDETLLAGLDDQTTSADTADLARILDQLPVDQRDVVLLRILADQSVADTAKAMGRSPAAVKALQQRALAHLRRILGETDTSRTPPAFTAARCDS